MATTYTTKQGDTWDAIAYEEYGDTKYTGQLMAANFPYLDVCVFGAGVALSVPELTTETTDSLPLWRST